MQKICEKETISTLTNEDIENKIKQLNYSIDPVLGDGQLFYILYKTTCKVTKKIYIGIHISNFIKDRYIGNGINSNIIKRKSLGYGISHLKRAVEKYGYLNFERVNLFYFKNKQDLLKAENLIVDQEFINNQTTLNSCLGGFKPPTKIGSANGNYGNKWSLEKRKQLSDFFKEHRNTKGENNCRAIPIICINLISEERYEFGCMKDVGVFLKLEPNTIRKYRAEVGHIFKGFWIIVEKQIQELIDLDQIILEKRNNLSVRGQFFRRWYWNEDDKDLYRLSSGSKWYRDLYYKDYKKLFKNEN